MKSLIKAQAFLLLGLHCFMFAACGSAQRGDDAPEKSELNKYANRNLTLSNYEAIVVGMKEDGVRAMLGEPVETQYSLPGEVGLELDGRPVDRILSWKDDSGAAPKEVVLWIKDGVVLEKGQSGLKEPSKE